MSESSVLQSLLLLGFFALRHQPHNLEEQQLEQRSFSSKAHPTLNSNVWQPLRGSVRRLTSGSVSKRNGPPRLNGNGSG